MQFSSLPKINDFLISGTFGEALKRLFRAEYTSSLESDAENMEKLRSWTKQKVREHSPVSSKTSSDASQV